MIFENSRPFNPVHLDHKGVHLNTGIGCPLGCAHCVQHKDQEYVTRVNKQFSPKSILEQVKNSPYISKNHYFLLGNASDPFLPENVDDTIEIIEGLDKLKYTGIVGLITKTYPRQGKINTLSALKQLTNIRPTIIVSYVGYGAPIEKAPSAPRLELMQDAKTIGLKVILCVRPLSKTLMDDSSESFEEKVKRIAKETKGHVDATLIGGMYYPAEVQDEFKHANIKEPFTDTSMEKRYDDSILPYEFRKIFGRINPSPVFETTSCAVSYVHKEPNVIGLYGLRCIENTYLECPKPCVPEQRDICRQYTNRLSDATVRDALSTVGIANAPFINTRKVIILDTKYDQLKLESLKQRLRKYLIWSDLDEASRRENWQPWLSNVDHLKKEALATSKSPYVPNFLKIIENLIDII